MGKLTNSVYEVWAKIVRDYAKQIVEKWNDEEIKQIAIDRVFQHLLRTHIEEFEKECQRLLDGGKL